MKNVFYVGDQAGAAEQAICNLLSWLVHYRHMTIGDLQQMNVYQLLAVLARDDFQEHALSIAKRAHESDVAYASRSTSYQTLTLKILREGRKALERYECESLQVIVTFPD